MRVEAIMIAINAERKADAESVEDEEIDTSETETISQTGPQAMRAVVSYCEAIRRQVAAWIAEETGEREVKPLHWKLTERHPRGGQDRNKSLYLQLTDCNRRLQNTWRQHIGVFSTSGDDYYQRRYDWWQKEIEFLKEDIKTIENAKTNASTKQENANNDKPFQQTTEPIWSDEEDGEVTRVKFCSEGKLQPMSTKILICALDNRSEEVEIDKNEVLACCERLSLIHICRCRRLPLL